MIKIIIRMNYLEIKNHSKLQMKLEICEVFIHFLISKIEKNKIEEEKHYTNEFFSTNLKNDYFSLKRFFLKNNH